MKEIKDDSDREIHHVSGVWNGRINTVKMTISPIYRFNEIRIKTTNGIFHRSITKNFTIYMKTKEITNSQHNLEKEGAYKGAFLSHKRGNLERLARCTRGRSASSSAVTQPPQQRRPSYGHYPTDATTLNPKGKTERRTDRSMFVFFTDTQTVLVSKAYNHP